MGVLLLGRLNDKSNSEKVIVPPPAVPSAYSEVFDRCALHPGSAYLIRVSHLVWCFMYILPLWSILLL